MKNKLLLLIFFFSLTALVYPQIVLEKTLDDDNSKYTNIGNIGLTITNFGSYGHGFSLWPEQPSCEYPLGSGIEHLFDGGLYIGAYIADDSLGSNRSGPFVTTGAVDAASVSARGGGFEWTNMAGDFVVERSSLLDSRVYDPEAVSHQDLVCDFADTSLTFLNGEIIENHSPLGLSVHQESYAWNFPFADYFVIMNYTIKNVSNKYLDEVFVGLWTDAVVRNTNISPPRGSAFFNKGGNGYSDSLRIAYEFDATGDIGYTDSYLGVQFLGADMPFDSVNFVSWQFRNATDPLFFAPQDDFERYRKMEGYFGGDKRWLQGVDAVTLQQPSNRSMLISCGPFNHLAPGDSVNVVFAIVTAKKFGIEPASLDTREQKTNLYNNAEWALRAYFGEDRNRNGVLDSGEDTDGNGVITRYILPAPPKSPVVRTEIESNSVVLYWDKGAESSVDPISGETDFEGYRLYRTNTAFDLNPSQDFLRDLVVMAEFDSAGNELFFNTGFNYVTLAQPKTFAGDTTNYYYRFEVDNLLNGWQYLFSVTAFDKGDPENKIESLESSSLFNLQRIIPGTPPTSEPNKEVGVYPNPYYGNAIWDGGTSERLRKIYFYNLPEYCEITIYTLSGDVVKRIQHDPNSNSSEVRWFDTFGDNSQQMSGGEHAWDLISDYDQAVATGLYLFSVKDKTTGDIKTGKFLIIK